MSSKATPNDLPLLVKVFDDSVRPMVQFAEANKIEQRWEANGRPYCEHPQVDKEYDLGMDSGDRRCLSCGDTFTYAEWKKGELTPRGVRQ